MAVITLQGVGRVGRVLAAEGSDAHRALGIVTLPAVQIRIVGPVRAADAVARGVGAARIREAAAVDRVDGDLHRKVTVESIGTILDTYREKA